MIVKLRLSGEQYFELLKFLQSPANRYKDQLQNIPDGSAFVKIMEVKASGSEAEKYKALCEHHVTLEIKQDYTPVGPGRMGNAKVPLSVLAGMFAAIGLYPKPPEHGILVMGHRHDPRP